MPLPGPPPLNPQGARRRWYEAANRTFVDWIDDQVDESGVLIDELDIGPGLAAVGGLVQAAFLIRAEKVADRGDVYDVRIFRIDDDAADALRFLQADVGECFAAVGRFVDSAAE